MTETQTSPIVSPGVSRIDQRFSALKTRNRPAFIPFIMAGDPDLATTARILETLPQNGADLIEIGMPFSDPMADGPVIEAAGLRALKHNISLDDIFDLVTDFRKSDPDTPIVLMGYYNPVYRYGIDAFCSAAANAGIDGMILVDLPPEEEGEFIPAAHAAGLALIKLITPTSSEERLETILKTARGFVYYVAVSGITGDKSAQYEQVNSALQKIRAKTDLPIAVGFGIKTPEDVAKVGSFADAAVVGSALVTKIADAEKPVETAGQMVKSLSSALIKNDV